MKYEFKNGGMKMVKHINQDEFEKEVINEDLDLSKVPH